MCTSLDDTPGKQQGSTMIVTSKKSETAVRQCPICECPVGHELSVSANPRCPSCHNLLWCVKRTFGGVIVLDVISRRNPEYRGVHQLWDSLLRSGCGDSVVVNLSGLEHGDTELVARLITLKKAVDATGGRLALCGVCRSVREILSYTRLDRLLMTFKLESDALNAFCSEN